VSVFRSDRKEWRYRRKRLSAKPPESGERYMFLGERGPMSALRRVNAGKEGKSSGDDLGPGGWGISRSPR